MRKLLHLIQVSLIGALSQFLIGCASSPERVEQRAVDLEIIQLGVVQMTQPRYVQGAIQHPDQAENAGQLMDLSLDQDDTIYLLNGDLLGVRNFVTQSLALIAKSRLTPCKWWNLKCKREQKEVLSNFKEKPK